jgi:hypothetical protein
MENAKDTFYITLRNRLAALNPDRTMVMRGLLRPGILVEENEIVSAEMPRDVFVLRWKDAAVDMQQPLALTKLQCEVVYGTDGNADNAAMDRGRLLTAMDAELAGILNPGHAVKMNYAQEPVTAMNTSLFWSDAAYGPIVSEREYLQRTATVEVFSYEEPEER